MHKILLVDDEQNILNALQRELREHFETETFSNPVAALERCNETPFDLVIADYKMPEMNGLEFLKQFGKLQPDAARLVLSGEADIDALIRTINETHIYRFLAKPWDKAELLANIRQALAYRDTILENRRQADTERDRQVPLPENRSYRIVLVEHDERLLNIMARGLTDEGGREVLYGAMQDELKQPHPKKFKCEVSSFRTAHAALEHAEKNHCDLIIASLILFDMDGIQLLHRMKQTVPDAARILVGADPDKALLSQAINDVEVHNLLPLHWGSNEPRSDIRRQAWNLYQLKTAAIQALTSRELRMGNTH